MKRPPPKRKPRKPREIKGNPEVWAVAGDDENVRAYISCGDIRGAEARRLHKWLRQFIAWAEGKKR